MKKLLTMLTVIGCVLTTTAQAETLKIIIPGGADGSYNTRFQILKSEIKDVWGDKVVSVWGNNRTRTTQLLNSETGPALTIWQAEYNLDKKCVLPLADQKIIAVETNGIRVCTSNSSGRTAEDFTRKGATFTVGHSDPHAEYAKWFEGYNAATGTNLKVIPYGSSGKARKGVLAGDVDFVFISPSNSNKLMKSGGKCFFSSLPQGEPKHNLPALSSVTPYKKAAINQGYFYAGFNLTNDQLTKLRTLYASVASGKNSEFTKFAGTKDIAMQGTDQLSEDEMVKLMTDTLKLWSN